MIKLLHAADFHLDSPFRGLPPELARQRRREARESLLRLAQFANAEETDLVLLAGDLFDGGELYRETAETLTRALGMIRGRVFIAPGNHDFYDPHGLYGSVDWPDNTYIFKRPKIEAVPVPELGCTVYGAAFTAPEGTEDPLRGFRVPSDGGVHLMVLHSDVDGARQYRAVSRGEIAESGLTYLALGHVHGFSGIQKLWNTTWAYPGCPEGRGFDECGPHGVIAGTVEPGKTALRFVNFARRKYEILRVDVTGREPLEALEDALADTDTASDIYRVVFTGTTAAGGVDLEGIRAALRERFYQLQLRDETTLEEDVWQRAGEDSLRGLFLQELQRCGAQADETERARIERAARFGLAALDGREL